MNIYKHLPCYHQLTTRTHTHARIHKRTHTHTHTHTCITYVHTQQDTGSHTHTQTSTNTSPCCHQLATPSAIARSCTGPSDNVKYASSPAYPNSFEINPFTPFANLSGCGTPAATAHRDMSAYAYSHRKGVLEYCHLLSGSI